LYFKTKQERENILQNITLEKIDSAIQALDSVKNADTIKVLIDWKTQEKQTELVILKQTTKAHLQELLVSTKKGENAFTVQRTYEAIAGISQESSLQIPLQRVFAEKKIQQMYLYGNLTWNQVKSARLWLQDDANDDKMPKQMRDMMLVNIDAVAQNEARFDDLKVQAGKDIITGVKSGVNPI
jgi:hypothetical protein